MVSHRSVTQRSVVTRAVAAVTLLLLCAVPLITAGCRTAEPITVYPSFTSAPALAVKAPTQVAVLPVEDGTDDHAVARHLAYFRQQIEREIVQRNYAPIHRQKVDAALRGSSAVASASNATSSVLDPTWLQQAAAATGEESSLVVRVDRWDESKLLINRRVYFQLQAALVDRTGAQLWYGTLSGEIKAGGASASPRDQDAMARSCAELAIVELLAHLPKPNRS